jgi:hypothetical protein
MFSWKDSPTWQFPQQRIIPLHQEHLVFLEDHCLRYRWRLLSTYNGRDNITPVFLRGERHGDYLSPPYGVESGICG